MSLPILEKYEQERNQRQQNAVGLKPLPTLSPSFAPPQLSKAELEKELGGPKPGTEGGVTITDPLPGFLGGGQYNIFGHAPAGTAATAKQIEKLRTTAPATALKLEQEAKETAPGIAKEQQAANETWEEKVGKFFGKLGEASTWLRVLKFILGGALIIVALVLFTHASGAGGGDRAPGVSTAGAVGSAVKSPALSLASALGGGAQKAASAQRKRTTQVSAGTRKRVEEGRARERSRAPETDRRGKPLQGGAATARERRRVKERAARVG